MKDLFPFESRYLDLEGIRYHYIDEGEGDPVVMLHGNPTWSFYFRELIGTLRDSYRVIAPDHIGCGFSDKPGADRYPYTLARRVEDLKSLLTHLGVTKRVTLVLHDWGGMIGMAWAVRNPDAAARFIVMNTAAFHLPKGKRFPWPLWVCRDSGLGPALVQGLNAFCLAAAGGLCSERPLPAQVRRGYLAPYDSWKNRIAIQRFVEDIPLRPGDTSYAVVSSVEEKLGLFAERPMILLWGERDFVFDTTFLREWMRRFPRASVHSFKDGGHYILEDKKDFLIPLVREFLRKNPLEAQ